MDYLQHLCAESDDEERDKTSFMHQITFPLSEHHLNLGQRKYLHPEQLPAIVLDSNVAQTEQSLPFQKLGKDTTSLTVPASILASPALAANACHVLEPIR